MKYAIVLVFALLLFAGCSVQDAIPGDGTDATITNEQESEAADETSQPADDTQPPQLQEADVVISLNGYNFAYEDEAGNVNPTITVKQGDVVRIEYATQSGYHDFVIDEFGATAQVRNEAGVQILEFTADQAGEFEYYCSVGSHKAQGMVGSFIVE